MLKIISTLLIIILLASCSKDGTDNNEINQGTQNSEIKAEDFVLRIFSDAETYQAGEIITIWAEFTYIGEEPYIEIFHAMPYLTFTIVGENDFGMSALQVLVLANTTLYRDEIQRFDFAKSGGFGEDDEDADFWRAFFDDPKLRYQQENTRFLPMPNFLYQKLTS